MGIVYIACCVAVSVWFALVWVWARRRDNWSLVDAAWAASPPLFALIPLMAGAESTPRSVTMAGLLALWGGRLSWHLHGRVSGGREREDPRYGELRDQWGDRAPVRMFLFFQIQSVTVCVLLAPAFLAAADTTVYPQWYDIAGVVLVLVSVAGESVADAQLRRFRADPANRGLLCEAGLWAYSRHPNYFFEWLVWVGFALLSFGAPAGFSAFSAPVMMFWLLRCVTGVPMAESRALRMKGEAWLDYCRRVNAFFPWFPKR